MNSTFNDWINETLRPEDEAKAQKIREEENLRKLQIQQAQRRVLHLLRQWQIPLIPYFTEHNASIGSFQVGATEFHLSGENVETASYLYDRSGNHCISDRLSFARIMRRFGISDPSPSRLATNKDES